jgi:excinuclease ABC subunit C
VSSNLTNLRKRIARASTQPGVYRWLDADGNIIYVGKAKNLRNRLRSYVVANAAKGQGPWKESMVAQLADFDVTITNSELEALMLETNLIKQIRPRYNVLMKDDKNYVYVSVSVQDQYPRIDIVRKIETGGARYFGPYLSPYDVRHTLDMLHEFFAFRSCKTSLDILNKVALSPLTPSPSPALRQAQDRLQRGGLSREAVFNTGKLKPCLDSQIGQCNGLCAGIVSQEEYRRRTGEVMQFFKGDYDPVIVRGKELMVLFAAQKKFERAAAVRDTLKMIERLKEKQLVSDTSGDDVDVVGVAMLSGKAHVEVMQKRGGKLIGEHHIALMGNAESIGDVLEQFLPQYYDTVVDLPDTLLVGETFSGRVALAAYLTQKRGRKVQVKIPERGTKSQLLMLAETNAQEKAKQAEATWEAEQRNIDAALAELVQHLALPSEPMRIEGYDISHTGGTETVGSMVVFVKGKPRNDQYRSFTIHTLKSGVIDDYRSLKEVLSRRLRHITGGLKVEEKKWREAGVTLGKVKKDKGGTMIVASFEGEQIGSVRLEKKDGKKLELTALTIAESYETTALGSFLARSMLRTVKKGKVYAQVPEELEQQYASLGFRHVLKQQGTMMYDTIQQKPDASLAAIPDLLVIDGGKGQLSAVVDVLKSLGLHIPVIGLAKREEEVFVPGKSMSILFAKDSSAKFMLMRLRDEAHRFANHHRQKRAAKHAI